MRLGRRIAVSSLFFAVAVVVACGGRSVSIGDGGESEPQGDDEPPVGDDATTGGSAATGGVGVGGVGVGGGMGGNAIGGAATGGGIATGGVGGTGNADACKGTGLRRCVEGAACWGLICGLADSGTRACQCGAEAMWTCTPCDFSNSPFRERPVEIPVCPADAADENPCDELGAVCGPVGEEYCACYNSPSDGLVWDCDVAPNTWR